MKRLHVLLRLVVLAALALSFAETVWASTCASMESMAMSHAGNGALPEMPGMPVPGDGQQGEEDPSCPLGAAAVAQGCVMATSLPATSSDPFVASAERAVRMCCVQAPHDLIDDATLFHPPRA